MTTTVVLTTINHYQPLLTMLVIAMLADLSTKTNSPKQAHENIH